MNASACPICGKPADPAHTPFCSRRCADIDLGHWLTGSYRLPTQDTDEADAIPDPAPPG